MIQSFKINHSGITQPKIHADGENHKHMESLQHGKTKKRSVYNCYWITIQTATEIHHYLESKGHSNLGVILKSRFVVYSVNLTSRVWKTRILNAMSALRNQNKKNTPLAELYKMAAISYDSR